MSAQHTQGRLVARHEWLVPEDHASRPIGGSTDKDKDRNHYANILATVNHKYHDNAANIRRLAACWNVCEHIPTADLEAGATLAEICAKSNGYQVKLAAARALLMESEKLLDLCISGTGDNYDETKLAPRIRAFLKGGA